MINKILLLPILLLVFIAL